jgi:hypothetical protein
LGFPGEGIPIIDIFHKLTACVPTPAYLALNTNTTAGVLAPLYSKIHKKEHLHQYRPLFFYVGTVHLKESLLIFAMLLLFRSFGKLSLSVLQSHYPAP